MFTSTRKVVVVVVGLALVATACATDGTSESASSETAEAVSSPACPTEGEEWEEAKVYIEHNATDADTGFHALLGGEPWEILCLTAPDGTLLLQVDPQGPLGALALSDLFFESNEPANDEYAIADLIADFPEGDYTVSGIGRDGIDRIATAAFTHDIPAEPVITVPVLVAEPEDTGDAVVDGPLVVTWEPVTETIDGGPVTITGYEVIVTMEEFEDPEGNSRPVYDVHVPADVTSLPVPDAFLLRDTVYELEVLALERSGNQTIGLGFFRTA